MRSSHQVVNVLMMLWLLVLKQLPHPRNVWSRGGGGLGARGISALDICC